MSTAKVRPAAVAGLFYPSDPDELRDAVMRLLERAEPRLGSCPRALIAPHAGYVYSGATAAAAYVELRPATSIRRVVLLGPAHRVGFRGVAVPAADWFETPLGRVAIDAELRRLALGFDAVRTFDAAHADEHSLEVQLPFLQCVLAQFTLLPLVVGDADPQALGELLDAAWTWPHTLIVVSTDLSHFHNYETAREIDAVSIAAISQLAPGLAPEQACGSRPLNGLLASARRRGLHVTTLDVCNSGDTAGDRARVVGYAAFALSEPGTTT